MQGGDTTAFDEAFAEALAMADLMELINVASQHPMHAPIRTGGQPTRLCAADVDAVQAHDDAAAERCARACITAVTCAAASFATMAEMFGLPHDIAPADVAEVRSQWCAAT